MLKPYLLKHYSIFKIAKKHYKAAWLNTILSQGAGIGWDFALFRFFSWYQFWPHFRRPVIRDNFAKIEKKKNDIGKVIISADQVKCLLRRKLICISKPNRDFIGDKETTEMAIFV